MCLKPHLKSTFSWFLELNKEFKIFINENELKYEDMIADNQNIDICANGEVFKCKYIQWATKLEDNILISISLTRIIHLKLNEQHY